MVRYSLNLKTDVSNVCDMRNNKMGHFCVVSTFIFLVKKMCLIHSIRLLRDLHSTLRH